MGDWNCLLVPELDCQHYTNPHTINRSATILTEFTNEHDLTDVWRLRYPSSREFTWFRSRNLLTSNQAGRLDRIYATSDLSSQINDCGIDQTNLSDHAIAWAEIQPTNSVENYRPKWILNSNLLNIQKNAELITKLILDQTKEWPTRRNIIQRTLRKSGIGKQANLLKELDLVQRRINITYAILSLPNIANEVREANHRYLHELQATHSHLAGIMLEGNKTRTRLNKSLPEANTSASIIRAETKYNRDKTIFQLRNQEGTVSSNTAQMTEYASLFYEELFGPKNTDQDSQTAALDSIDRQLDTRSATQLSAPLTGAEIATTIKKLAEKKSPGPDGFTSEFYKKFKDDIAPMLLNEYTQCLENNSLNQDMCDSTIILLFKKGDRTLLKNYRPISLLSTEYKILSKLLAERLKRVLPSIAGDDQYGFVPGRSINDPIRTCQLLIDYVKGNPNADDDDIALLFVDQEKAFDRVDRNYMYQCLERFGIPDSFIKWIKLLYNDTTANICINGYYGRTIRLQSGVRQGCPLSPLLYILTLEPLANLMKNHPNYKGITIKHDDNVTTFKSFRFADDTGCVLTGSSDLVAVEECLKTYTQASGAKVNIEKCELLPLGNSSIDDWITEITKLPRDATVRYLGAPIGNNLDHEEIWQSKAAKLTTHTLMTKQYGISLNGRVNATQTYLISSIRYLLNFLPLPDSMETTLNRICQNFALNKTRSFLSRQTLELAKECGGLSLPNIQTIRESLDLKFVKEILSGSKPWQPILLAILDQHYYPQKIGLDIFKQDPIKPKRSLPPHLLQVIKTFRAYHGKCTEQATLQRVMASSLLRWTNAPSYGRHGLTSVEDIFDSTTADNHIRIIKHATMSSISKNRFVSRQTHEALQANLPELRPPKLLLQENSPNALQLIEETDQRFLYEVLDIANGMVSNQTAPERISLSLADTHKLEEIAICPDTKRLLKSPKLTTKADYTITVKNTTITLHSYTANKFTKAHSMSPTHHHHPQWNGLDPPPLWPKVPPRRMHPTVPRRLFDLRYKAMHGRLAIGPTVAYFLEERTYDPTQCPLCRETDSIKHCFLECPHIRRIWSHIQQMLRTITNQANLIIPDHEKMFGPNRPAKTSLSAIKDIFTALMQHVTWTSRCRYIYDGIQLTPNTLLAQWRNEVTTAIKTCQKATQRLEGPDRTWLFTQDDDFLRRALEQIQTEFI